MGSALLTVSADVLVQGVGVDTCLDGRVDRVAHPHPSFEQMLLTVRITL